MRQDADKGIAEATAFVLRVEARVPVPAPPTLPVQRRAPVSDRIPLTHDGVPDVAAMHAMGLGRHAEEWGKRMRVVAEFCEARTRHGKGRGVARMIAEKFGVSVGTIYNWHRAMLAAGPAALVPAWDSGRGRTVLPLDLQCQVREFYLNSRRANV